MTGKPILRADGVEKSFYRGVPPWRRRSEVLDGKLGYCPQIPLLWEKLTVAEHFELFARAYELDAGRAERATNGLLAELQLERYRDFRIEDLSGGTRQKLNLALALMHEPETYLRFWEMTSSGAVMRGRAS